jgi:hypothetical protein
VGWTIHEFILKFVAAATDRLVMHASNSSDLFDSAMPSPHGFAPGNPASLLFVESIQQSIELSMIISDGIFQSLPTHSTITLMTRLPCHGSPTFP